MTGGADVSFSADGTLAAYSCAKRWDLPLPPETPTIRSRVWVRWCELSRPEAYHDIEIGVFGRDWGGWNVENLVHTAFSPDNRYLAVVSPRHLLLIDRETGEQRTLTHPDEVVTSLTWLDKQQLGFASCTPKTDAGKRSSVVHFWRQRISPSSSARELILSQERSDRCPDKGLGRHEWPRERWSPDGSFVLFSTESFPGDLMLLDVAAGTARSVALRGFRFEGISWKADGSAAACVGLSRKGSMIAFVIDPRTGEKVDFSDEFNGAFSEHPTVTAPSLARLWTPDNQFVIVNSLTKGGCLVKPRPWELIPTSRRFIDRIARDGSHVLAEDRHERAPWVFWQPTRGWVRIWVQFQEQGYRRGMDYLVDHSGRTLVPLNDSSAPGGECWITPDGNRVVTRDRTNKLVVRQLTVPSLSIEQ